MDSDSGFARNPTGWFGNLYMLWVSFTNWVFGFMPLTARLGGPRPKKEKDTTLAVGDDSPPPALCNVNVMVKSAKKLPKMDLSGKADPYVLVNIGAKEKKTATVKKTLDPVWNESFMFEIKQNSTANIVFTVMDWDSVGSNEVIGYVKVPVQDIFAQQSIERDFEILHKNNETVLNGQGEAALLSLSLTYSQEESSGDAEWLNGVIRKAYRVIKPKVNAQVKEQLNATFASLAIPVIQLELASCSIGESSPWLMGLELLPSRSDQDIQIRSTLRWVADGEFHVKVLAKAGPASVSVSVSDLEIQFPAWIQVRLQSADPNAAAMHALQLAATEEPTVRFSLAFGGVSTAAVPGVESAIDYAIRTALKGVLVLPNKVPAVDPDKLRLDLAPAQKSAVGRLSVKILEGDELKMASTLGLLSGVVEAVGTVDPFIVATYHSAKGAQQRKQTKTISNSVTPKWNEFAEFLVHDEAADRLVLEVFDAGPVSSDLLGAAEVKVSTLLENPGWSEDWYNLTGKDVRQGRVRLGVEYAKFVPDDGPEVVLPELEPGDAAAEDVTVKPPGEGESRDRALLGAAAPAEAPAEPAKVGKMLIRVVRAADLPATDLGGSSDPYVVVSSPITGATGKEAFMKRKTKTVKESLDPQWEEEFAYMESTDPANAAKTITLHLKDADQFGKDEWVGKAAICLKDIMAAGEDGKEEVLPVLGKGGVPLTGKSGRPSTLTLFYSFSEDAVERVTDVGAEWVNGALRKGFRLFGHTIDEQVRASLRATLEGLTNIPGCKKFSLEEFSVGSESPWIMEIRLLPSRSDKDIQLMCRLRWVCDGNMVLKIRVTTSAGLGINVKANNLELEFPAWIQAGIQSGLEEGAAEAWEKAKVEARAAWEKLRAEAKEGEVVPEWVEPGAEPPVLTAYKVAATEEPVLKFGLKLGELSFGAVPGLEDTLDSSIRSAVHNALVLPNAIASSFVEAPPALSPLEQAAVGRLSIKVYEAEGLVDPDAWGSCDPFVGLTLVSGKSGQKQTKKTKTVYNTTAPRWNTFVEALVLDAEADALRVEVLDEDLYKTDSLGTLNIQVRELSCVVGWVERWYTLDGGKGGRLRLGLSYEELVPDDGPPAPGGGPKIKKLKPEDVPAEASEDGPQGTLEVGVLRAEKLPKMDFFGGADPFVELRLGAATGKTKVIKKKLDPEWGETFSLDVKGAKSDLILTVKDWEKVGKNETIGFARVAWADLEAAEGGELALPLLTKDGERVKDGSGAESRLVLTVQLKLNV